MKLKQALIDATITCSLSFSAGSFLGMALAISHPLCWLGAAYSLIGLVLQMRVIWKK